MKKIVSETIDGSIKDIIQLKTLDASLEYSQLFDALEDCPQEFQSKLVGALNSLGETMQISPTEAFNKVLCKSDENEDVKKRLYNWWRAVFEVLSQCKIPDDRVEEYNQKVDDLMAEILKAGDGEATAEEEPEDVFAEEYEPASMEEEAKMLENMDFAIQELGEIATKVQDLVNFVNPYCGTEVNESMMKLKFKVGDMVKVVGKGLASRGWVGKVASVDRMKPGLPYTVVFKDRDSGEYAQEELEQVDRHGRFHESSSEPKFKEGDIVRVKNVSGMDFHGRDAPIGPIVEIEPPHPDVGVYEYLIKGRSGEFFAYEDELELVPERFTEENEVMDKPARYCIGDHVLYKGEECVVTDVDEDLRNDEEIYQVSRDSDKVDGLSFNDWVTWDEIEPLEGFTEEENSMKHKMNEWSETESPELTSMKGEAATDSIDNGGPWLSEDAIIGMRVSGESSLENELNKGDDGWTEIGQPVGEATVVVDADTVWDVLELLDDDVANQNLTELINSHVRTEDEIMDAIENILGASGYSDNVPKAALNGMFSSDNIHELIGELGLDVDAYMDRGVIQDAEKPTSVELESGEEGETKKVSLYVDWDDDGAGIDSNVVIDVPAEIADSEESDALYDYISDWIDHQDFCVNDWAITDIEGLMDEGSEEVKKPEEVKSQDKTFNQDGETKTLVTGEEKKEMSDAEAATIMGGASGTDMDAADMGVSSHEVADPYNKKPVCEMTIEQEIVHARDLLDRNLLWGPAKENFRQLLDAEPFRGESGDEEILQALEAFDDRNLTKLNDRLSYDFETVLEALGCDINAWTENLEILRDDDWKE